MENEDKTPEQPIENGRESETEEQEATQNGTASGDEQEHQQQDDNQQENEQPALEENEEEEETDTRDGSDVRDMSIPALCDSLNLARDQLRVELELLEKVPLKDYTSLAELKQATNDVTYHTKHLAENARQLHGDLRTLTETLASLRTTISTKIKEEEVDGWIEKPETDNEDSRITAAETKARLAAAAKTRQDIADAGVEVAKAVQDALEAAELVNTSRDEAAKAAQEAEKAKLEIEEARQAAIQKERSEAEARERAAERAKQKAEEERKQQAEEQRQQRLLERAKGTPEEQRLLKEREERERKIKEKKDPDKWPRYTYSVEPSESLELPLGCIVRSQPGSLQREDIRVERLDQLDCPVKLAGSEELVGNIVTVTPSQDNASFNFEEPMALAFPHIAPKNNPYREAIVKVKSANSNEWMALTSKEVFFSDIKDFRFVEVRLKRFGTFAVVTRFKKDSFTAGRKGARCVSSVDGRVSMQIRPTTFNVDTKLALSVQPVELSAVSDLRTRYAATCSQLLASSPILHLTVFTKRFSKPAIMTIPCPPNPSKFKRPQTAVSRGKSDEKTPSRPKSAFHTVQREEEDEDSVHLLKCDAKGNHWVVMDKVQLGQSKNKDVINFELQDPVDRLLVLRTQNGISNSAVEKIARQLGDALEHRIVQIVLRQHVETLNNISIHCCLSSRMDRTLRKLSEEGFDEGPNVSSDLIIKEGQPFEVRFRGNIGTAEDQKLSFIFNSLTKNSVTFSVEEKEHFAQKSLPLYRGFAQMVTRGLVPKEQTEEEKDKRGKQKIEYEEADVVLTELLISLPKLMPEEDAPQVIQRAPVKIVHEGPVNEEVLRYLAKELGDEWKLLAKELHIRQTRIQAILRNNVEKDTENTIYDMLVTWAKRIPRSMDKAELLIGALEESGRDDLAAYVYDVNYKYRQQRAEQFRELHLRRAFVTVAQSPKVAADWRVLGRNLGMSENEIAEIEQKSASSREQCLAMLIGWSKNKGDAATAQELARYLRRLRHRAMADQVILQAGGV